MVATKYLTQYIKSVSKNSLNNNPINHPLTINLVISGGAFNCGYGYGAILYLKELQSQGKIVINKVSGCSSGSLLALVVLCCDAADLDILYVQLQDHFKEHGNLNKIRNIVKTFVNKCLKNDKEAEMLSGKLFITTTDITNYTQKVTSKYKTREDVICCIISSCYIPFFMDKTDTDNKYIDGIVPYLFSNGTIPSLYINLMNTHIITKMLTSHGEMNPHYRIMQGVVETAKFFNEEKSNLCSWMHKWNVLDFCLFRLFHLIVMLSCIVTETMHTFYLPNIIKHNILYTSGIHCISSLIHDCMFR